jgi:hypothetical protein
MDSSRERERGVGVAQVVETNRGKASPLGVALERSRERLRPARRAVLAAEDEIVLVLIGRTPREPLGRLALAVRPRRGAETAASAPATDGEGLRCGQPNAVNSGFPALTDTG